MVFPLPGSTVGGVIQDLTGYTSAGVSATTEGIQASSGPSGGPTSVITFSAGAGYYNQAEQFSLNNAQNTAPANVAYVMPYMPMDTTTGPVTGNSEHYTFQRHGFFQ